MREIKFRAKATNRDPEWEYRTNYKNGDWVYGLLTKPSFTSSYGTLPAEMTNTRGISGIEVDDNTLGQFTGLRDTNRKEIYEGDIIRCRSRESINRQYTSDYLFIVVFNEDKCKFELVNVKDNKLIYDLYKSCEDDYRVEGNIYDNPELMEME